MSSEEHSTYRIHDFLELGHRLATVEELNTPNLHHSAMSDQHKGLLQEMALLDNELLSLRSTLNREYRDILTYLKILDHKIKTLTDHLIAQQEPNEDKLEAQPVTLSESGICFHTTCEYPATASLRLEFSLKPSYHRVAAYGDIIKITPQADASVFICAQFTHLQGVDSQAIARHIMRKQAEERRTRHT